MEMLKDLLRISLEASDPLVVLQSNDHNEAITDLTSLCSEAQWRLMMFKTNVGFLGDITSIANYATKGSLEQAKPQMPAPGTVPQKLSSPASVQAAIMTCHQTNNKVATNAEGTEFDTVKTILVIQNVHRILADSPAAIQTLIDSIVWMKRNDKSIILLIPKDSKLPSELDYYRTVVNHPEPDLEALKTSIRNVRFDSMAESDEELVHATAIAASGLTINQVESATARAIIRHGKLNSADVWEHKVELFNHEGLVSVHRSTAGLEKLGGMYFFKDLLAKQVQKGNLHKIIIAGPAGCGKTSGAFALGYEYKLHVLEAHLGRLGGMYVGESEKHTRHMQEIMEKNAPCIVVMDELPRYLNTDSVNDRHGGAAVDSKVGAEWLTWLSSPRAKDIMIVATANEWKGVGTLIRSERFDFQAFTSIYSSPAKRKAIWDIYLKEYKHDITDSLYQQLLNQSAYYTGAEIKTVCRLASKKCLDEPIETTLRRVGFDWNRPDRKEAILELERKGRGGSLLDVETGFLFESLELPVDRSDAPVEEMKQRRNIKKKAT